MKVFPDDLLYSREHIWVRLEGDLATIGITDYAQEKLGEIASLELPETDSYIEWNEPFGNAECSDAGFELISPVSGTIISVNEDILDDIGVINSDPYETGWLIVVELEDQAELEDLLDARGYQDFVAQEGETDF
jgi:glycine cleavage system H protein